MGRFVRVSGRVRLVGGGGERPIGWEELGVGVKGCSRAMERCEMTVMSR